jgi:hypothetical protein
MLDGNCYNAHVPRMDRTKFRRGFRIGLRLRVTALFILIGLAKIASRRFLAHMPWYAWVAIGLAAVVLLIWTAVDAMRSGGSKQSKAAGDGL